MQGKTPWTEMALYYLLWAISTLLTLVNIWAGRLAVLTLADVLVAAFPPRSSADNPKWTVAAIDMFAWLILIAAGLSFTILVEYRLRRAADTVSETSGAVQEGGPRRMMHTALTFWAWQVVVIIVCLVVRVFVR